MEEYSWVRITFDDYALVLGYFVVNEQVIKIINEKIRKALEIEEEIYNKEVKNFFKGKSKDEINEIIKFIKFNIYHMAPYCFMLKIKLLVHFIIIII